MSATRLSRRAPTVGPAEAGHYVRLVVVALVALVGAARPADAQLAPSRPLADLSLEELANLDVTSARSEFERSVFLHARWSR